MDNDDLEAQSENIDLEGAINVDIRCNLLTFATTKLLGITLRSCFLCVRS